MQKFEAGVDAIQLYSALVFGGLDLLDRIKHGLTAAVRAQGKRNISELERHENGGMYGRAAPIRPTFTLLPWREGIAGANGA